MNGQTEWPMVRQSDGRNENSVGRVMEGKMIVEKDWQKERGKWKEILRRGMKEKEGEDLLWKEVKSKDRTKGKCARKIWKKK